VNACLGQGGITFLKNGAYSLASSYITPVSNSALIGETRAGVVITAYSTASTYAFINGTSGVNNVLLSNFTLNANNNNSSGTQTPNVGLGIVLIGNNNRVEKVTVYNTYLQGIVIGLSGYTASTNCIVNDCEVYNTGNDGIILANCKKSHIYNSYIHNTYGAVAGGINICYGSQDSTAENCIADYSAYGFGTDHNLPSSLVDETNIQFVNCTSDHSLVNGFMFDGGKWNKCVNCTARNFGNNGFTTFSNGTPTPATSPKEFELVNCVAIGDGTVHTSNTPCGFLLGGGGGKVTGGIASGCVLGMWVTVMDSITEIAHIKFSNNIEHHFMGTSNTKWLLVSHLTEDTSTNDYTDPTTQTKLVWDSTTIKQDV
jgi:hypothetical protein